MDVRKYRFTTNSYNALVMPFCSLTKVLLLIKAPPLILTLLEFWNIVGFKRGSRRFKDFVAVVLMLPCCAHVVRVQNMAVCQCVHNVGREGREKGVLNRDCGSDEMSRCSTALSLLRQYFQLLCAVCA